MSVVTALDVTSWRGFSVEEVSMAVDIALGGLQPRRACAFHAFGVLVCLVTRRAVPDDAPMLYDFESPYGGRGGDNGSIAKSWVVRALYPERGIAAQFTVQHGHWTG